MGLLIDPDQFGITPSLSRIPSDRTSKCLGLWSSGCGLMSKVCPRSPSSAPPSAFSVVTSPSTGGCRPPTSPSTSNGSEVLDDPCKILQVSSVEEKSNEKNKEKKIKMKEEEEEEDRKKNIHRRRRMMMVIG